MSSNKDSENTIITRQKTTVNSKLKDQVNERNQESLNIFKKSSKIQRSPPPKRNVTNSNNSNEASSSHTYANVQKLKSKKDNLIIINETPSTSEGTTITSEGKENRSEEINNTNLESPNNYFTPKFQNQDSAFFDHTFNLTYDANEYTDIGGILNEQSLILSKTQIEVPNQEQNQTLVQEINQIEAIDNRNLIDLEINMANTPLKLPLKEVARLVPDFDGENMTTEQYIEKLKQAKKIISATDEHNLVQLLKMKLDGEINQALMNVDLTSIDDLIMAIRTFFPSTENLYTLYGKLTQIVQKPSEAVLTYANRIRALSTRIKEIKAMEEGVSAEQLAAFKTNLENDVLKSFKAGLKQEIRLELGEVQTTHNAIRRAIEIESKLESQKALIGGKTIFKVEEPTTRIARITYCQICQERDHEAMFCTKAGCVYCKNEDHMSYNCNVAKDKLELICNFCSKKGHTIEACSLNYMHGNHCQYCQSMGHKVTTCPIIKQYEHCWKCKGKGHTPNMCEKNANVTELCNTCGNTNHTAKNCPHSVCEKCNKPGHTMKFCQLNKNMIWCTRCSEDGHATEE